MTKPRIDTLREVASKYGRATLENDQFVKSLAQAISKGFAAYLGTDARSVGLVPPTGPFDPLHDYRDAAFSSYDDELLLQGLVRFRLCIEVPGLADNGAHWLALPVEAIRSGDQVDIFIGTSPKLRIPVPYEDRLEPVFERLYQGMADFYSVEQDARLKIGFTRSADPK